VNDPWAFGWTQLFTAFGLITTIIIAIAGFRTFGKWRREKLEEKRIEVAIEALALCYEARFVFDGIRSAISYPGEWADMPQIGLEAERSQRGSFYAILKRVQASKDFFDRAWKVQVRCTAVFGANAEETFLLMQKARREVEVSAEMLYQDPQPTNRTVDNMRLWQKWRNNVWATTNDDSVTTQLKQFREQIEKLCRPIVDHGYKKKSRRGWQFWKKD
jgi:hypothetical protein